MTDESPSAKKMPKSQKSEVMSDDTFESLLDNMDENIDSTDVNELLKAMNENSIISNEEAEYIMEIGGANRVVKCGLPEQVRPTDPENRTDVESSISRMLKNDPTLTEVNLNNMKRTPLAQIGRLILALQDNTHVKKLSFANTGLTDTAAEPFITMLEINKTLEAVNFETNYLSGDFLARFFKAAQNCASLSEIKCVNQSAVFSTESEMLIMDAVKKNEHLTKVSANLRHPEARNKVEQSTLRNAEMKRRLKRLEAAEKNHVEQKEAVVVAEVEKKPEKAKNVGAKKSISNEKPSNKEKPENEAEKPKLGPKKSEDKSKEPAKSDTSKKPSSTAQPKVAEKPAAPEKKEPPKTVVSPKSSTEKKPTDLFKKQSNASPIIPEKPRKEKPEPEKPVVAKKPSSEKKPDLTSRVSTDKAKPAETARQGKLDRSKVLPSIDKPEPATPKETGKEGAARVYKKASLPRK